MPDFHGFGDSTYISRDFDHHEEDREYEPDPQVERLLFFKLKLDEAFARAREKRS